MTDWIEKHLEMAIGNRYKSPIEVIQDQIEMQMEKDVMKVVQNYGINVDKEELLKALKYDREQYEKGYQDGLNADKWIPCSERLPNSNGCYLVWRPRFFGGEIGMPAICYFDGQNTWHDAYGVNFARVLNESDVVAWQPLPEPYKGE